MMPEVAEDISCIWDTSSDLMSEALGATCAGFLWGVECRLNVLEDELLIVPKAIFPVVL
jgi:hypothetical protein